MGRAGASGSAANAAISAGSRAWYAPSSMSERSARPFGCVPALRRAIPRAIASTPPSWARSSTRSYTGWR